jgi:hypothetical protein
MIRTFDSSNFSFTLYIAQLQLACYLPSWCIYFPLQVVQEFILGIYDEEATAAFNQNLSDISTLKDPRSKDASQR